MVSIHYIVLWLVSVGCVAIPQDDLSLLQVRTDVASHRSSTVNTRGQPAAAHDQTKTQTDTLEKEVDADPCAFACSSGGGLGCQVCITKQQADHDAYTNIWVNQVGADRNSWDVQRAKAVEAMNIWRSQEEQRSKDILAAASAANQQGTRATKRALTAEEAAWLSLAELKGKDEDDAAGKTQKLKSRDSDKELDEEHTDTKVKAREILHGAVSPSSLEETSETKMRTKAVVQGAVKAKDPLQDTMDLMDADDYLWWRDAVNSRKKQQYQMAAWAAWNPQAYSQWATQQEQSKVEASNSNLSDYVTGINAQENFKVAAINEAEEWKVLASKMGGDLGLSVVD